MVCFPRAPTEKPKFPSIFSSGDFKSHLRNTFETTFLTLKPKNQNFSETRLFIKKLKLQKVRKVSKKKFKKVVAFKQVNVGIAVSP